MIGILLIVGVLTLVLYYLAIKPLNYWVNKNVPTEKVTPLFGENLNMLLGKENFADFAKRMYDQLPNSRYVGVYQFQEPILMLKCPELIKKIFVKDFDHFLNRKNMIPEEVDELFSKNLVSLKGQKWKNMRSKLSPSFTSSKMKYMFVLMCRNANIFVQYFLKKNQNVIEVEFKDAFTRYTNDVIASVVFGLEVDSLSDKENQFYMMGKKATNFNIIFKLKFLLYQFCPSIAIIFRISPFGKNLRNYFVNLVKDSIKLREEQNIKRPDMLGLLMEARERKQKEYVTNENETDELSEQSEIKSEIQDFTEMHIVSQLFVFFLAGFDTVASAMCFMAQELVENPDVQKRLIEEIDENKSESGTPSYETIAKMTYLDMVVSETLRKWPIAILADRVVTKPYTIQAEQPGEKPIHLEKNERVQLSIYGIHRDPKHYENPEQFNPERFSPINKKTMDPYTYLPFGVGPRNCIASRFALLELKSVFFYILSNFEIVPVEKTNIPIKISKSSMMLTSINGFNLGLKKRF